MKSDFLVQALDSAGFARLLERTPAWHGLLVLTYHRIGNPAESLFDWDVWSADEETFDRQMHHLVGWADVIGVDDLDEVVRRRRGRYVIVTFDDGYQDNYHVAYPMLRSHGIPGAFFISTGYVNRARVSWWDEIAWMVRSSPRAGLDENIWTIRPVPFDEPSRVHAIRRLQWTYKKLDGNETGRYMQFLAKVTGSGRCPNKLAEETWMTWDMIRELDAHGMGIGGHTVNHPVLSNLCAAEQEKEIGGACRQLKEQLSRPVTVFSYPVGRQDTFNAVTRAILEKNGIRWAFSYYGGYHRFGHFDRYDIPRVAVDFNLPFPRFRTMLALPQVFADTRARQ